MGIYSDLAFIAFFLSMLLFGIYFPEPVRLESRYPWAKWILIGPSLTFAALDVIITLGRNVDFQIFFLDSALASNLGSPDRIGNRGYLYQSLLFYPLPEILHRVHARREAQAGYPCLGGGDRADANVHWRRDRQIRNRGSLQDAVPCWYFWTCSSSSFSFRCPWPTSSSCNVPWMSAYYCAKAHNTRSRAAPSSRPSGPSTLLGVTLYQLVNPPNIRTPHSHGLSSLLCCSWRCSSAAKSGFLRGSTANSFVRFTPPSRS